MDGILQFGVKLYARLWEVSVYMVDDIAPTKLSVTVPTALPMAMSDDGSVVTATGCKIINNSYGPVRVKNVTISAANGWHLTAYGDKASLAWEKVDSHKLGFAIRVGGSTWGVTTNDDDTQLLIDGPIVGCYMSGVGNPNGNYANIDYAAIVTPLSSAVTSATVATVVFVVEWDAVEYLK